MFERVSRGEVSFLISADSSIEKSRVESLFEKEPETIAWIDSFIKEHDVFFDVGANIGVYTLYAASKHPIKVFSFEPAYHNFYKLCKNIYENSLNPRVTALPVALSDGQSFVQIELSSAEDGSASHSLDGYSAQKVSDSHASHIVATASIDYLVKSNIISIPNHIKIDVDGFEMKVVEGMRETLSNHELRSILIEFDHTLSDSKHISTLFGEYGFVDTHPINQIDTHSRKRRNETGNGHIENVIYTRL